MSEGMEMGSLLELLRQVQDAGFLRSVGFLVSASEMPVTDGPSQTTRELDLEEDRMQLVMTLTLNMLHHRLLTMMQHWRGFPGRAAQMLSAEPDHALSGLSYFKHVAELWEAALAEVRESSSTCVSSSLRLKLQTLFSFGQSKIQEDTFRLQRQTMERSGSSKQSLSTVRKWMIPVAHEVASKLYNYLVALKHLK
eukprot:50356-Amphidinium_carterae.1